MRPAVHASRLLFEALEPRILYAADLSPLALAGAAHGGLDAPLQQPVLPAAAAVASSRSEIAFVDLSLPDAGTLLADLQAQREAGRAIEVVGIAADEDGLAAVSQALAARAEGSVGAVHLLSHGSDGVLQLGAARLDAASLLTRAGELAGWSGALASGADLLLYGCDFAATSQGRAVADGLAALTGADVAASSNLTGATALGGDWRLEYSSGVIDTGVATSLAAQARWMGTLATFTVTTTADSTGPNPAAGTLRWAIKQANDTPGADTITFAVDGTFSLAAGTKGDDSNANGDFDILQSVTLVGRGSDKTIIQGNGVERVFDVRGGTVVMQDLTVRGGNADQDGGGIRVRPPATLELQRVVVRDNSGSGDGAGIFNEGTLRLRDVELRDNTATGPHKGGGLHSKGTSDLLGVSVSGNVAGEGGGVWASGAVTATNATFSDNSANGKGGAIYTNDDVTLNHVTIAYNSAGGDKGGGVYFGGDGKDLGVRVANSIVALNTGGDLRGGFSSQGYNLFSDGFQIGMLMSDRWAVGAAQLALAPLADNGAPTDTHALLAASIARDAASPLSSVATDQRGQARSGRADIGAYEYVASNNAPTISAVTDRVIDEDQPLTINFTVGDAETAAAQLRVTASSGNTALVRNSGLQLGGSGANRTLTLTPVANANGGPVTITLAVSDGYDTTLTTFRLTVRPVNDAPVANDDVGYTPAGQKLVLDVLANDRDVEGDALTISSANLLGNAPGTLAIVGNKLEFTPDAAQAVPVQIEYTVRDAQGAYSNAARVTVYVAANTPPTSTAPGLVTLEEDGSVAISLDDLHYADADNHAMAGLRIDTLPTGGVLRLDGVALRAGSYVSSAQVAAGSLVYTPAADGAGAQYDSLRFSVQDALGAYAATPNELRFHVTPMNDAPELTGDGGGNASLTYVENSAPRPLFPSLQVTDVDSPTLASALVRINDGYRPGEDRLLMQAGAADIGNITARFDVADGRLELSSAGATATLAQWQAALRAVAYENTSDDPGTAARSIGLQVDDGSAQDSASNVARLQLTVQAVNDAPVLANVVLGQLTAGQPRLIDMAELLAGATDAEHDVLSAGSLVLTSGRGTLLSLGGGRWQFTADADASGSFRFSFDVSDGQATVAGSADLTVTAAPVPGCS